MWLWCLFSKEKALDGIYKRGYFIKSKNKNDRDFGEWDIDDLYEPDITGMDLTDEEMEKIRKEHERLGIED